MIDSVHRRAALIATAVTVPFVVIVGFALGLSGGDGANSLTNPTAAAQAPITTTAPPHGNAESTDCTKVLQALPVQLGSLNPRVVHTTPDSPFVVAWGNPAIVLSCGVDRPKDLVAGSSTDFIAGGNDSGPYYDVTTTGSANVYTTVDRGPYIAITIPSAYQGADYLPPLSQAIAQALPAVCSTDSSTPNPDKLCTRRP